MIKNPIVKEKAWLSSDVERLLGKATLETATRWHGCNISLRSDRLAEVVNLLVKAHGIKRIVETGTHDGSGTTLTYAKTGIPVHTCEADRRKYLRAKERLIGHQNVFLNHAFTTSEEDSSPQFREHLGTENASLQTDWLASALLQSPPGESILVSLDSGGEVGIKEAEVLVGWINSITSTRTVCLILDDIYAYKHKATIPMLEEHFGVDVYQVEDRWGFTVIEVK